MTKRINPAAIQEEIIRQRERIRAKVLPEVTDYWSELEARQEQDRAETEALVEVYRERRSRAQASADARSATIQENTDMAIDTMTETAQPGRKKKGARQRIQQEMSAVAERKAVAQTHRNVHGPRPNSAAGKKRAAVAAKPAARNGQHGVVEENKAAAKKEGVRIKLWMKGAQSGKATPVFQVYVMGTRVFAISGNIDSLAAAKAACKAAGFEVKSLPEAAKKK